jgi:hypothetical protein
MAGVGRELPAVAAPSLPRRRSEETLPEAQVVNSNLLLVLTTAFYCC